MKKIILCFSILIITGMLYACNNSASMISKEEIRITENNIQNESLVTDGEWVYYCDGEMKKIKISDGTEETIDDVDAMQKEVLFCIGDKLYFYDVFDQNYGYIDLKKEKVIKELELDMLSVENFRTDGQYYYINGEKDTDGNKGIFRARVGNINDCTKIMDIDAARFYLHGDYLYVMSWEEIADENGNLCKGTWRIDLDGKNKMCVLDFCPNTFIMSGDDIFYIDEKYRLCSMKLDGTEKNIYEDIIIYSGLNATEEYVFYTDKESNVIHRMSKDGTENIELSTEYCASYFNIIGEWLIYANQWDEYEYYKMNFDGSINCSLREPIS